MLKLILGRAGTGKTHHCLDEIRERLLTSPEGPPLILILPEHATFQIERELAATPEISGFARANVFGFRRLAHRVLLETGGAVRPHITELGKRLVLSRLLIQRQEELRMFHRAAKQRSFADTLAGMIREFKTYAISPEKLMAVRSQVDNASLSDKLHDLYLLYHEFESFLQFRYTDPEDYLNLLVDKISQSTLIQGAEVWVDGFSWFNPREFAVLQEIMHTAAAVNITLCLTEADAPEHSYETDLFHRQWDTRRKLLDLAAQVSLEVQETELRECWRFADSGLLQHLERQFFIFPPLGWKYDPQGLVIVEAANRRVEVEGMARDIISLCRDKGYRWRDIAILIRDTAAYADVVETVLADFDIPYFSDQQRQPVHHPLAELLRSALEVVTEHWSYEPVFRCLKTDLFPVQRDEIDQLENYVVEFGIHGFRWTNPQHWSFVRRWSLGEEQELDETRQLQLAAINDIRFTATAPLISFEQKAVSAENARGITVALYDLLTELQVPEKLEEWAIKAEQAGDLAQAREHKQIWSSVVQLLEQVVETCGDQALDLPDYAAIINDGLEGLKLSLIPPGLDYVTVSPLEQTTIANLRAVYVPGVNDGVLPMHGRGEGILTDAERSQIAAQGLELAPGSAADSFAEQFLIYTALTRASNYLWVSYPLADEEGKGLSPSLIIDRLKELAGGAVVKSLPAEPAPGAEQEYLVHPRRSISALAAGMRLYKSGKDISQAWWDVYNWALRQPGLTRYLQQCLAGLFHKNIVENLPKELACRLYTRSDRLKGSVTRFESFRACPFKHFACYGLSLKERQVFRLQAPDLGQFLHAAMKDFGERMRSEGREWGSVTPGELGEICSEIAGELAPRLQNEILLSSAQYQHMSRRLEHTIVRAVTRLAEFDRVSRFKPLAMEKAFGWGKDALPPLAYGLENGITLELGGQIDRLDVAEFNGRKYLLIIDYKSGGAWLRLPEVYHGLKLQLLTYLLVAQNLAIELVGQTDCQAAGVLYYFIKNPSISSELPLSPEQVVQRLNSMLKMPGWALAEPDVVRLLDSSIEGRSEFLKIALSKDNTFWRNCQAYIKTAEEFSLLLDHVGQTLIKTGCEIISGDVAIRPYMLEQQTPCSYCPYRPVCQFDRLLPENDYHRLAKTNDTAIMAGLTGKGEQEP